MALITTTSSETAATLESRIATAGAKRKISNTAGYAVAYSANSLILRQKTEVVEFEYVGLSQGAAEKLVTLNSDSVTTTIYYKSFGANGDCAAVGIETGTRTKYNATRDGESRMWTVRRTDETLSAYSTSGWSTTRPSNSGTGVEISKRSNATIVARYQSGSTVYSLVSTETVTVTRYRFRTKTEATTLVTNNTSAGASYTSVNKSGVYVAVLDGTNKSANMEYIDNDYGYVVDVTTTVYTHSGW